MHQNVIFVETQYKLEDTKSGSSVHINLSLKQSAVFVNEENILL